MTRDESVTDLTGKLLIAMPGMGDQRFSNAVIFMCAHSDEGAMGLIVNKPTPEIDMAMLLDQLSIEAQGDLHGEKVRFGGPVETGRGFVLHSPDYSSVVTTDTHWFITYNFYFPRRYGFLLGHDYENVMRTVLMVVRIDGGNGTLELMENIVIHIRTLI